jgi:hypothetical protein
LIYHSKSTPFYLPASIAGPTGINNMNICRILIRILTIFLALLLAMPTSTALYSIVNPPTATEMVYLKLRPTVDSFKRIEEMLGQLGAGRSDYSEIDKFAPRVDYLELAFLYFASTFLLGLLLQNRRYLPMLVTYAIPFFECMRYYRTPEGYLQETKSFTALFPTLVVLLVGLAMVGIFLVYRWMLKRIGLRWATCCAIAALLINIVLASFGPIKSLYSPVTSGYPGTAWLVLFSVLWFPFAWIAWKLGAHPIEQVSPPMHTPKELTFEEAYARARQRKQ